MKIEINYTPTYSKIKVKILEPLEDETISPTQTNT